MRSNGPRCAYGEAAPKAATPRQYLIRRSRLFCRYSSTISLRCFAKNHTSDQRRSKRLINPNVAIEYGYAQRGLGDEAILMVQNTHYGDRERLPFDLRHKAGPIQYSLVPDASRKEIEAEGAKLRDVLIDALKPYLSGVATPAANSPLKEMPITTMSANRLTYLSVCALPFTRVRNLGGSPLDYFCGALTIVMNLLKRNFTQSVASWLMSGVWRFFSLSRSRASFQPSLMRLNPSA